MAELKTKRRRASAEAFLDRIADKQRRQDCEVVSKLMKQATKAAPQMWGPAIVGFGDFHYRYASGREGDWFETGFSPRKESLTLYLMPGLDRYGPLLAKLGKHKTSKSCLHIKKLSDVDLQVLNELIERSVKDTKQIARERKEQRSR